MFTCHRNVGQSPEEDPYVAGVVSRLHQSVRISSDRWEASLSLSLSADFSSVNPVRLPARAQSIDSWRHRGDACGKTEAALYSVGLVCTAAYRNTVTLENVREKDKERKKKFYMLYLLFS